MKHIRLNKEFQWDGRFTDLFIIGCTRGTAGASDFTDADNAQTINLLTPAAGDIITYPAAVAYTKIAFVGDSISGLVLDVGPVGAASEEFIKDISGMHLATGAAGPLTTDDAEAAGMTKKFDGSTAVAAVFTKSGGTQLALLTAGEIWIYLDIIRRADMLTNRYC